MNILIPMAGRGERFEMAGYNVPKPLINIEGLPMFYRAIESYGISKNNDHIFIIQRQHDKEFFLSNAIKALIPNSRVIISDKVTDGPACSALLAKEYIDDGTELVIMNCDQIMEWDVHRFVDTCRKYDACLVTYHSDTPKNSYAKIDKLGYVKQVKEKEVISNVSLNGIHYWGNGHMFVDSAEKMIEANDRYNNEFYIAPSYNVLIDKGFKVGIHHIPNQQHIAVGTPEDLDKYLNRDR